MQPTVHQLATICAALLAAGYVVFLTLLARPATRPAMRAIWPSLISLTITVAITVGAFLAGGWLLLAFVTAVFARVNYEAALVTFNRPAFGPSSRAKPAALIWTALCVGGFALALLAPFRSTVLLVFLGFLAAIPLARMLKDRTTGLCLDLLVFPLAPALIFALAAPQPEYAALAVAAYMMVETFDSYALLGGKTFGRTQAFPHLSPKKTLEGLGFGVVMLLLTTAAVGNGLSGLPLSISLPLAVFAGLLTVAGDLAASLVKRRAGVKDFPVVSRMQGGVLDIYDAWITTFAGLVFLSLLATLLGMGPA